MAFRGSFKDCALVLLNDNFAELLSVAASSLPMSDLPNRATAPRIDNQKMSRILPKRQLCVEGAIATALEWGSTCI